MIRLPWRRPQRREPPPSAGTAPAHSAKGPPMTTPDTAPPSALLTDHDQAAIDAYNTARRGDIGTELLNTLERGQRLSSNVRVDHLLSGMHSWWAALVRLDVALPAASTEARRFLETERAQWFTTRQTFMFAIILRYTSFDVLRPEHISGEIKTVTGSAHFGYRGP